MWFISFSRVRWISRASCYWLQCNPVKNILFPNLNVFVMKEIWHLLQVSQRVGRCQNTEAVGSKRNIFSVPPKAYPTSKTGSCWGLRRPALMASRLVTFRSLECQSPTPPSSHQWLLIEEAKSWHQKRWYNDGQSFRGVYSSFTKQQNFVISFLKIISEMSETEQFLLN